MEKLNYKILDSLRDAATGNLEVTDIDVKRLRDDRSEIQPGDEIAFVATASFRLTHGGVSQLKKLPHAWKIENLAVGDELLVIGPDAEVRCDKLPIDEDSVLRWLADRYDFTFLLNGSTRGPFRPVGRVHLAAEFPDSDASDPKTSRARELALPWIQKLNTAAVKGDYIDVDVRIDEKPQRPELPGTLTLLSTSAGQVSFAQAVVGVELKVVAADGARYKSRGELVNQTFRLPLTSDHGDVELWLTVDTMQEGESSKQLPGKPADPAVVTKPTRHNS